jgi:hypothetical protein
LVFISLEEGNKRLRLLVFRPRVQLLVLGASTGTSKGTPIGVGVGAGTRAGARASLDVLSFGTKGSQLSSTAKLIREVAKIYTKEQKYNRLTNCFDYKLTIFLNIY